MYPPKKQSDVDKAVLHANKTVGNPYQATPIFNTKYNQNFQGLPISDESLRSGILVDTGYTQQDYSSVLGKNLMRAIVNFDTFAVSTIAALPNFIDNQLNNGQDRIMKPINELNNTLLKKYQPIANLKSEEQSIADWATPTWISGKPESAWGDLIDQIGLIGGITAGTMITAPIIGLGGELIAAGDALSGLNASTRLKNALTTLLKPTTLKGATALENALQATGATKLGLNAEKLLNGLSLSAKSMGLNAVQSYTEAIFEGLEGERNFIEQEKLRYLERHGEEPTGDTLKEIQQHAQDLKNDRFLLNAVGLAISNQPFTKAFFGESGTTILDNLNKFGKSLNSVGDIVNKSYKWLKDTPKYLSRPLSLLSSNPLVLSEGFEELYQLGVEKGLDNYYTNKIRTKNFEAGLQDILEATKAGASSMFSKEGIKSFILGAGIGTISQGVANFKEYRDLTKYLNTSQKSRNAAGEEIEMTPAEQIKEDVGKLDESLQFLNPLSKNPSALSNTFGERMQQFVNNANNAETMIKVQGTALEYDVAQKAKFDSLFPYIKKGYKEVIADKLDGMYRDLEKTATTDTEKNSLTQSRAQAFQDIETIEKFTKNTELTFSRQFPNLVQQLVYNQLKDLAVYHSWNAFQIARQDKDIREVFGSTIFDDKVLDEYNGKNIDDLIQIELSEQKAAVGFEQSDEQKRLTRFYEGLKGKTEKEKKQAYWDEKYVKGPTEPELSLDTYYELKKNQKELIKRIARNNDVIDQLEVVKNDVEESKEFLNEYYGNAYRQAIRDEENQTKAEAKDQNKEVVNNLDLTDAEKAIILEEVKDVDKELTTTELKAESATAKKILEKIASTIKNIEATTTLKQLDLVVKKIDDSIKLKKEVIKAEDKQRKKLLGEQIPASDNRSEIEKRNTYTLADIKDIKLDDGSTVLNVDKITKNWEVGDTISVPENLEFDWSGNEQKQLIQILSVSGNWVRNDTAIKREKELKKKKANEVSKPTFTPKSKTKSSVASKVFANFNSTTGKSNTFNRVPLKTDINDINIKLVKLPLTSDKISSGFPYDVGLLRTTEGFNKEDKFVFEFNIQDINDESTPSFRIQDNLRTFKIDLKILKQYIIENNADLTISAFLSTLMDGYKTENVSFVSFLGDILTKAANPELVFQELQAFTFKNNVEQVDKIIDVSEGNSYLFNFPNTNLINLHQQLTLENKLFNQLKTEYNKPDFSVTDFITNNIIINFQNVGEELPAYTQPIVDSGAYKNSVFEVVLQDDGEYAIVYNRRNFMKDNNLTVDQIIEYAEKIKKHLNKPNTSGKKNKYIGYYVGFETKGGEVFIRSAKTKVSFEEIEATFTTDDPKFKVGFLWTNSTTGTESDEFYNVEVKDGKYHIKGAGSTFVQDTRDKFEAWYKKIEAIKAKTNSITVTFYQDGLEVNDAIYKNGKTNYISTPNTYVEIQGVEPVIPVETPQPASVPVVSAPDLNQIVDDLKSKSVEDFKIALGKDTLTPKYNFGKRTYDVNPDVTAQEIQDEVDKLKSSGMPISDRKRAILQKFYTINNGPLFSTFSEYQLNKIQEFIKNC